MSSISIQQPDSVELISFYGALLFLTGRRKRQAHLTFVIVARSDDSISWKNNYLLELVLRFIKIAVACRDDVLCFLPVSSEKRRVSSNSRKEVKRCARKLISPDQSKLRKILKNHLLVQYQKKNSSK